MTETLLSRVVSLQRALDHLADAKERLHGIPDWMRELHEEHSAEKEQIAALEKEIEESRLERRSAESEIETLQQKLKRYQQQINTVQNQREYGALLQEIDTVKAEISRLEETAYGSMERREEAESRLEELRKSFEGLDQRYSAELEKWEAQKPEVRREVEALETEIEELREVLPRPQLALFDRILERYGGEALAAIRLVERGGRGPQVWHCQACNYRVRPQVIVEIRSGGNLIQCDSCKRILYVEDTAEQAPA